MHRRSSVGIAVLGVVLAVLGACSKGGAPAAGGGTTPPPSSPPPTTRAFAEKEWTIVVPTGWTRADATKTTDSKKAVRYTDAAGDYFVVAIDPLGSDFSADTVWRYDVKGRRFEIVQKEPCANATDPTCSTKDRRYDGYIMWRGGTNPPKVGGHVWYFIFGNTKTTTVDLMMFETIAEGLRVRV